MEPTHVVAIRLRNMTMERVRELGKSENRTNANTLACLVEAGLRYVSRGGSLVQGEGMEGGEGKGGRGKKNREGFRPEGAGEAPEAQHIGEWVPSLSPERLKELADAEPGGLMACSPELLTEFKEMAKTDPVAADVLRNAGVELPASVNPVNEKPKAETLAKKIPGVKTAAKIPPPADKNKPCPSCGSLHGMHAKYCKERR